MKNESKAESDIIIHEAIDTYSNLTFKVSLNFEPILRSFQIFQPEIKLEFGERTD